MSRKCTKPKHTGAFCAVCKVVAGEVESLPFRWQSHQWLHDTGSCTGKMKRFNHAAVDLLAMAYNGKLVPL